VRGALRLQAGSRLAVSVEDGAIVLKPDAARAELEAAAATMHASTTLSPNRLLDGAGAYFRP
jgi:antitoxin component of MazEF toxin-antitoxin module